MKVRLPLAWFYCLILLSVILGGRANAQEFPPQFPSDQRWLSLPCGRWPMVDPYRDQVGFFNELDLVGDLAAPAAQLSADYEYVYFRFRLDKNPINNQNGSLQPFAWGIELGNKDDPFSYQSIVSINGQSHRVEVYTNSTVSIYDVPDELADLLPVEVFPFETHGQVKKASGTGFGGDDDYWISMAVPWAALNRQGIEPITPLLFWVGSSSIANALNGDLACHDGSIDGAVHLSTFEWDRWITLVSIQDSDGDGYTDEYETQQGTDPYSSSSYPPTSSPSGNRIPQELVLEGGGGCNSGPGHPWQVKEIGLLFCFMALGGRVIRKTLRR